MIFLAKLKIIEENEIIIVKYFYSLILNYCGDNFLDLKIIEENEITIAK